MMRLNANTITVFISVITGGVFENITDLQQVVKIT